MAQSIVILSAAFVSITVVSIAVRMYTRVAILKNVGSDDYLICLGAIFAVVCSVTPLPAIQYGLGRPTAEQKLEDVAPYQKWLLASSVSYSVSASLIKFSLLTFFTRLSSARAFTTLVYVMLFIVGGTGIGSVTTVLLQCRPLDALWDASKVPGAKCIRIVDFYYANAALNITTDVLILLLPIRVLWGLHMPLRQRLSLCALFGMGGLACIASIVRLISLSSLLASSNPTQALITPLNWSIIELNVSVFIAGGPALKAFLRHLVPSLLGSSYAPTGPSKYGSRYGSRSRQTHAGSIPLGSMHDKNKTVWRNSVSAKPGGQAGAVEEGDGSREGSQENILRNYHGILQEVTVSVKSERRSLSSRAAREERNEGKIDF